MVSSRAAGEAGSEHGPGGASLKGVPHRTDEARTNATGGDEAGNADTVARAGGRIAPGAALLPAPGARQGVPGGLRPQGRRHSPVPLVRARSLVTCADDAGPVPARGARVTAPPPER